MLLLLPPQVAPAAAMPQAAAGAGAMRCCCASPSSPAAHPPARRPQLGRGVSEYIASANDEVALLIQCETRQCYEDLEVGGFVGERGLRIDWRQHSSKGLRNGPSAADQVSALLRCCGPPSLLPPAPAGSLAHLPGLASPCSGSPLQAILSVPGVDCCFMGPVDLSHALGLAQRLGFPACFDSKEFQVGGGSGWLWVWAGLSPGWGFSCIASPWPCTEPGQCPVSFAKRTTGRR